MTGVDSRNARPFDLLFDTYNTNYFPTDQTMYVFTRSNIVILYTMNGVKTVGR
jgi:hypothetical protein